MYISTKYVQWCLRSAKSVICNIAAVLLVIYPALAAQDTWQDLVIKGDRDMNEQKFVPAEESYKKALKEIKHSKHNDEDVAKCLGKLAAVLTLEDKTNDAIPVYRKAIHKWEEAYGKESPKLVPTLFSLGSIYESEGDPKIAIRYYRRALTINEKNYGPRSLEVADNLHRLGHANAGAGQNEQAENNYRESLSVLMQQPSQSSSKHLERLLPDYNDLLKKNDSGDQKLVSDFQNVMLKDRIGFPSSTTAVPPSAWKKEIAAQSKKANEGQNNEEQQILSRGFKQPFSESTLAPAYNTMSEVLHNQHPYMQGEDNYKRMIAIDIKTLGPNHPAVADDLTGLALLYISQHKYALAKPLLTKALAIYEAVYGDQNLLVTRTRDDLAEVCNNLGQTQEAAALYSETFNKAHIAVEPNNLESARMLNELAFLYYRQGKLEDACTVYQWALASTEGALGRQNVLVAACLKDYANVLRSMGRDAEANQMMDQASVIDYEHLADKKVIP